MARGRLSRTYRHLGRYQQILTVLVKHGFAEILERLEIERRLGIVLKTGRAPRRHGEGLLVPAERVRRALEELGPTFIKLGQLLSTRPDLISLDAVRELGKLQTQARPFPGVDAVAIVEKELGRSVAELFRSFEVEPLATASLGQVHGAELTDGRRVVVKVQRPDIHAQVTTDLEILEHLARLAERRSEEIEVQRPREIVSEFARVLDKELNYTFEAAHLRRFARMFQDRPGVRVPEVFRELSTPKVLTMERFDGVPASRLDSLRLRGYDLERIAVEGATAILEQIFLHGIFHADPHPGNVMVLDDGVIGFIDLGQVGRLDRSLRHRVARLLTALAKLDEEAAADALLALTTSDQAPDRRAFEADLSELIDWHLDRSVGEIRLGRMLYQTVEIASGQRRRIPPELFLVLKALATVEGLAHSLAPEFTLSACAQPVLTKLVWQRLSPPSLLREARAAGSEWLDLLRQVPGGAVEVLQLLRRGKLHVEFEHKGLEPLLHKLEQVFNRMVFAVVLAALLIASSLVALGQFSPLWNGIPIIGLAGYLLAGVLGLALLISILRRGRL
ncbi:MAG TPA: AarF/ABC1/UbiB kinase family protein [Thermoanaerobaculia bacterium]|jgi:ubiquinone biosynthesis protein